MKISFWTKFGIGVKSYLDAFKFVFNNGLWVYFFYPVIIAILMFIGGYALIEMLSEEIEAMVMGYFESDATGWTSILTGFLSFFIGIAFKILFFFIYSTFSKYILLIVMSPIMALLSEKTDEIITGNKYPFKMEQFVRDVFRGIAIALRNMFIEFGIIIGSFFFMWIPVVGWLMPIVLLIISYYYYGFSMIDYTSERRRLKIKESIRYIRNNKGLAIGNGFIFALLFSIPLFGGMLASVVAPVAATIAVFELEKKSDQ